MGSFIHRTKRIFSFVRRGRHINAILLVFVLLLTGVAIGRTSLSQFVKDAWAAVANIDGAGTINQIAAFSNTNTIGDSIITDNGVNVGIGTTNPQYPLEIIRNIDSPGAPPYNSPGIGLSVTNSTRTVGAGIGIGLSGPTYSGMTGCVSAGCFSLGVTGGPSPLTELKTGTMPLSITGGNVGIGTTNPLVPLHVKTSVNGWAEVLEGFPNQFVAYGLTTNLSTGWGVGVWGSAVASPTDADDFGIGYFNGGTWNVPFKIDKNTGNVGIGTTNPGYKIDVNGDARVNGVIYYGTLYPLTGTTPIYYNTCCLVALSDQRLKQNINPLHDMLNKFSEITPVTFNWRSSEFPERKFPIETQTGLIAQDVEALFPEAVHIGPDGYKYLNYDVLTSIAIEAIKEQQRVIEDLTKRVEKLEEK